MVHPIAQTDLSLLAEPDAEDEHERRSAYVPKEFHGKRLDKFLVEMADELSRSHLQTLIDQGHVQIDGVAATSASRKVLAGQRVEVELVPTPESRAFKPEAMALRIIFEDEALMVVDKSAGLVVHPAAGNWSGTLLNGVLAHHAPAATLPRAGIVHRLDKDTSGLMVIGKTLPAVTALVRAIAAREVHREYRALVHGRLEPATFRVDAPIGRDPSVRVKMAVVPSGKPAQTDVVRLAMAETPDGPVSAVRCKLHTGRTHQIRVHMASRGFPLLCDLAYGGRAALGMQRQALHASQLGFAHPLSAAALSFDAALPADMQAAWQQVDTRHGGA